MLPWTSPGRRGAFQARIAMQSRQADAERRYQAVIGQVTTDAGLMMDRARYLRDTGYEQAARDLFARSHNFTYRPADAERFLDMMVLLAKGAAGRPAVADGLQHRAGRSTTSSRRAPTSA